MTVLENVRVIDFGQYIAGPLTAMLLADQGADVIRVDPPGGPRWDTPANATWNRSKRSIVLDLRDPSGLAMARNLVASADVLVENFRPGVMERLGLGSANLTVAHPGLVYCSIPGFAADDPRARLRAWEGVVGAATACYRPNPASSAPVFTAIPIASTYAAFQAATAVAMALLARERDRVGQRIEIPMFDAVFQAMGYQLVRFLDPVVPDPLRARAQRLAAGINGQMQCADERWVMYMGANKQARVFLEETGAAAWVDALAAGEIEAEEVGDRARRLFRGRSAVDWESLGDRIGTECGLCRTSDEWLDNEHALGSGIVCDLEDPLLGRVRGPGINVRLSTTPGRIRFPRRRPNEDTEAIRHELAAKSGASPGSAALDELRPVLEGVKVLDFCIVLAGPTCGRTLGEFGADVVKVDGIGREVGVFHNDVNRAKRSILVDLKKEQGQEVLASLIDWADVIVQNFRNGVADRLGFGYEAVHARKPGLVYASLNYAGQVGPWSGRPGHEQIAQAVSGMQERFGGPGKPTLQPYAVNDYGTGIMGAFAVALALRHARRTGEGQHVDTSLAYTATMLQSSLIQRFDGGVPGGARGQDALGSGALHRAYRAQDGWVFVGARRQDLQAFDDFRPLAALNEAELSRALEARFSARTVAQWCETLAHVGIGAHPILPSAEAFLEDAWVRAHGLVVRREHDGLGVVSTNAPSVRMSRTPAVPGRPAPAPGSDARSVLQDIAMGERLEALLASGAVAMTVSK